MNEQSKYYLPEKLENDFDEFYRATLLQDFMFLEPQRKKYLMLFFRLFVVLVLLICEMLWLGELLWPYLRASGYLVEIFVDVGGCIIFLFWKLVLLEPIKKYKKDTKKVVMPKITAFFSNIVYLCENAGICEKEIRKSDLFDGVENVYCDDAFKGTYQGTDFQIAEQRLTWSQEDDKKIFKGVLLLLKLEKNFRGQTVVRDKKIRWTAILLSMKSNPWIVLFSAMYFSFLIVNIKSERSVLVFLIVTFIFILALWTMFFKEQTKYEKVYLEDIVFAKNWMVKATDQVEARYILTPALMERMLKIKRMFYGKSLHFAFFDNKVLIAVGTNQDMFETTSLFSSALNYQKVREVIAQFYSIFATIEELKQSTLDRVSKK